MQYGARTLGLLAVVILMTAGCQGALGPQVTPASEVGREDGRVEGVPYALPRHRVEVTCIVERTETRLTPLACWTLRTKQQGAANKGESVIHWLKNFESTFKISTGIDTPHPTSPSSGSSDEARGRCPSLTTSMSLRAWVKKRLGVDLDAACKAAGLQFKLKSAAATRTMEADPSQTYFVDLRGGDLEERSLNLKMSQLGLIKSAKASSIDKGPEIAGKIVKSIGDVVASVIGLSAVGGGEKSTDFRDLAIDGDEARGVHGELKEAGACQRVAGELLQIYVEKRRLEGAIEAALSQVDNTHPETLKFIVDRRKQQIANLKGFFFSQKTETFSVTAPPVLPVRSGACSTDCPCGQRICLDQPCAVMWISPRNGVRLADTSVYVEPKIRAKLDSGKWFRVELMVASKPCRPQFVDVVAAALDRQAKGSEASLRYRVPRQTEVIVQLRSVTWPDAAAACSCTTRCLPRGVPCSQGCATRIGDPGAADSVPRPVFREAMAIAQLGVTLSLPLRVGGNIEDYHAEFYEELGALNGIVVKTSPANIGAFAEGLSGGVTSVLTAEAARRKAKLDAATDPISEDEEIATLKARLENLVEIERLSKELLGYGVTYDPETENLLPEDE